MAFTKKNDEAVSPVIGVILMVAVTVILAAVIAAFVFGMAGNLQSAKTVGITLTVNSSGYGVATIAGGADLPSLSEVDYNIDGGTDTELFGSTTVDVGVGKYNSFAGATGHRVILIGTFNDGTKQTLVDKQF